jgi:hypothetical protein
MVEMYGLLVMTHALDLQPKKRQKKKPKIPPRKTPTAIFAITALPPVLFFHTTPVKERSFTITGLLPGVKKSSFNDKFIPKTVRKGSLFRFREFQLCGGENGLFSITVLGILLLLAYLFS